MKIRKPKYYDAFQCIGSNCQDTCCAGWEIEIDEETAERYHSIGGEIGKRLKENITETEEEVYFNLQEGKRCPFLNSDNLCDLILEIGENALCDICREHPRHYQWFGDYTEVGLGLCCEEAGRLLFQSSEKLEFVCLEDNEQANCGENDSLQPTEKCEEADSEDLEEQEYIELLLSARETAYTIMQNRSMKLQNRLTLLLQYGEELQEAWDVDDFDAIRFLIRVYQNQDAMYSAWKQLEQMLNVEKPSIQQLRALLHAYEEMESLDGSWQERMDRIQQHLTELLSSADAFGQAYPNAEYEYEHFAVYLLYRYFMEALFDGDILSKVKFVVASELVLWLMDLDTYSREGSFTLWSRIQNAKQYSKEIEYCTENMETFGELCWQKSGRGDAMEEKQTIFFDMDGTILDTEKYYREYWKAAAEDCGYHMTDEQALAMRSLGRPFAAQQIQNYFGSEEAYSKIRNRRMELMNLRLQADGIPVKPYAKETLEELKNRGYRLVIATATDLERTKAYLQETGLMTYFEHLICATMVKQGKPAPDIYQYACEVLGVNPEETYAVEDSPNGVLSAYRAGCRVIMIPDQTQPEEELQKLLTLKVDSLKDLLDYFR